MITAALQEKGAYERKHPRYDPVPLLTWALGIAVGTLLVTLF